MIKIKAEKQEKMCEIKKETKDAEWVEVVAVLAYTVELLKENFSNNRIVYMVGKIAEDIDKGVLKQWE